MYIYINAFDCVVYLQLRISIYTNIYIYRYIEIGSSSLMAFSMPFSADIWQTVFGFGAFSQHRAVCIAAIRQVSTLDEIKREREKSIGFQHGASWCK